VQTANDSLKNLDKLSWDRDRGLSGGGREISNACRVFCASFYAFGFGGIRCRHLAHRDEVSSLLSCLGIHRRRNKWASRPMTPAMVR